MKAHEREVAGIRCGEVLEDLSDYLDGELPAGRVRQIEEHLAGCDWCERFGGDFARSVARLRERLAPPPAPPRAVHERLMRRLDELGAGR